MQRRSFVIILIICFVLIGCKGKSPEDGISVASENEEAEEYSIPKSFILFGTSTVSDFVESAKEEGDDYCTDVKETPDGAILYLTETQKNKLIAENIEFLEEVTEHFLSADENYKCELDDENLKLRLYYDENIDPGLQIKTIMGIVSMAAFNHIINEKTTDWKMDVEIYNCHSNNLVVSVCLPEEEVSFGEEEWRLSY